MPWPTRSRNLYRLSNFNVGGSIHWLGPVPGGYTYLIKDLVVFNYAGSTRSFVFWALLDGVQYPIWATGGVPTNITGSSTIRSIVLPPGCDFGISASAAGNTGVWASGARLGSA